MQVEYTHMLHSSGAGISVDYAPATRPYDVKCIESDSHSSIYTIFVLGIINAMINLKQFGPPVWICIGNHMDLRAIKE